MVATAQAGNLKRRNDAFQSKAGTRQPAKKASVERKAKAQETTTAKFTQYAALALVGLLAAGFFLEVFKLILKLF
ncbi:hypothetical protein BDY24DRAFT_440883 [Mrakia frigida]|uniref:uncharacterized protein n=1 Tax=Mrakia frigida TaxID=29902 RepID=UPI003FCBFC2D